MGQCFFSGSNSGEGFYNCFAGVIPPWEWVNRYFMIKGGSGVGKSTLMRRVAEMAEEGGDEVEYFYCSGDPDSLDAVRLVKRGIVFADATAPHCMDPAYPGAVEEILNLGDHIRREEIVKYRAEVEELTKKKKESYGRAYAFLAAAAVLERERHSLVQECVDMNEIEKYGKLLLGTEDGEKQGSRRLFLNALTCKGRVDLSLGMEEGKKVYRVSGNQKDVIINLFIRQIKGKRKVLFCNPLCPQYNYHLLSEDSGIFLTCGEGTSGETISAERFFKKKYHEDAVRYDCQARNLEDEGMICLKECKELHEKLEEIYKECVDFKAISERTEALLALLPKL